jgi:uncharacterized protein YgiM (DUF1202 family)
MNKFHYSLLTSVSALSLSFCIADESGVVADTEENLSSMLDLQGQTAHLSLDNPFSLDSTGQMQENQESLTTLFTEEKKTKAKAEIQQIAVSPFTGKVKAKKLRLRAKADLDSTVVKELDKGELLTVVAEKGDFWVVEPPKNVKAFVFRTYILDGVVEANNVNVRQSPSTEAAILAHLKSGDKIEGSICESNSKWMEITLPSSTLFFVAKQYIENVGGAEVKVHHEKRRAAAESTLKQEVASAKEELAKCYPDIHMEKVASSFQNLMQLYPEFEDITSSASDELAMLQEQYMDKRLSYKEPQVQAQQLASSQLLSTITDKMKLWEHIEESLYLSWSTINDNRSLDEYYADQKIAAATITGILEPYTAPVKCKPGDYIIKENDLPVAYVYSTQINLQSLAGQKVTLKGSPRPNNNFAFPAFFVHSIEQ